MAAAMDTVPEVGGKKPRSRRLGDIDLLNDFVIRLKRGQLQSGTAIAMQTIDLIRALLSSKRFTTVDELLDYLHHVGSVLSAARPQEQVTVNIVRRILRIVREEGKGLVHEVEREEEKERSSAGASAAPSATASPSASPPSRSQSSSPPPQSVSLKRSFSTVHIDVSLSLHSLLDQPSSTTSLPSLPDSSSPSPLSLSTSSSSASLPSLPPPSGTTGLLSRQRSRVDGARESLEEVRVQREWLNSRLKPRVHEEIAELMNEIDLSEGNIAAQATEHIYANETILTYGYSATVLAFLKEAARFRRFEVMVVESAPSYAGQEMALKLAIAPYPIDTTVITDSAVYAIMPAINKVLIGCHAVMADGSLIVPSGGFNIALAAHAHSVPLVVLTGLHKLSPLYSHHSSLHNIHQSPSQILSYDTGRGGDGGVRVENPLYEEVSADLVDLLITNLGGHNPSYIYRLLSDCYHTMDHVLRTKKEDVGGGGGGGVWEGIQVREGGKADGMVGMREDWKGKEKVKGGKVKDKDRRKTGPRTPIEEE